MLDYMFITDARTYSIVTHIVLALTMYCRIRITLIQ